MSKSSIVTGIILVFLLSLFVFQQINLTTADIGRHITNGKLLINAQSLGISRYALLHTNFFSFTYPDFPFVNHHWGSGVLSYLVFLGFGFEGLSLLYGGFVILATLLLFYSQKQKLNVLISFPIILFLIPLITERTEVRPEGLSYLFLALTLTLLYLYVSNKIHKKWLWWIPVISLIWVNTHIYFIFIPFFIGMFLIETLVYKDFEKTKTLTYLLGLSVLALFINPYGIAGVLYPFTMFQNYGYLIVENQSIPFLTNLHINNPNFLWWKIASVIFIISSLFVFWKHKVKFPIALFGIALVFGILSFLGIRHLTAYGLVLIPIFLHYGHILYVKPTNEKQQLLHTTCSVIVSAVLFVSIFILFNNRLPWNTYWGIRWQPDVNRGAEFVKTLKISGPIFSNYDIGGYIIFHMYPQEKVFVDNRPETYPAKFFLEEYIPMQESESVWNKEVEKWNFNTIWFYRNDLTPWAQKFLITRIADPLWAPVFVDNYSIIFLRRVEKNAKVIEQYELPKSMFSVK